MTTRLPLLTDDQVGPPDLVAAIRQRRGGSLIDLDRLLLHSPPFATGWGEMMGRVRGALDLPPLLRELAMCGVSVLLGASFEIEAHAKLYREAGGNDPQLQALLAFGDDTHCNPVFDATQRAVLALTYEMTCEVVVGDITFADARAALGDDRLTFELVAIIASYNMVGRILVALKLDA
jgi:alkylhydroperoxidase family enzyme